MSPVLGQVHPTPGQPVPDPVLHIGAVRRVDHVPDRLADHGLHLVSIVGQFRRRILQPEVQITADDQIGGCLGQDPISRFTFLQGRAGVGFCRDVPADAQDSRHGAVRRPFGFPAKGQKPECAIGLPDDTDLSRPGLPIPPKGFREAEHLRLVRLDDAGLDVRQDIHPCAGSVHRQTENAQHGL